MKTLPESSSSPYLQTLPYPLSGGSKASDWRLFLVKNKTYFLIKNCSHFSASFPSSPLTIFFTNILKVQSVTKSASFLPASQSLCLHFSTHHRQCSHETSFSNWLNLGFSTPYTGCQTNCPKMLFPSYQFSVKNTQQVFNSLAD